MVVVFGKRERDEVSLSLIVLGHHLLDCQHDLAFWSWRGIEECGWHQALVGHSAFCQMEQMVVK